MINISDTMTSIRWMFEKYAWMAAETNAPMPIEKDYPTYSLLSEETQALIRSMHPQLTYAEIARQTGVSKVAVRRVILGLYKGKRVYK